MPRGCGPRGTAAKYAYHVAAGLPPNTDPLGDIMLKKILSALGVIAILIAAAIGGGIGKQLGKAVLSPSSPTAQQIEEKLIEGFTIAAAAYFRPDTSLNPADSRA